MTEAEQQKLQEALDLIHGDPNYRVLTRLTLPENASTSEATNTRNSVFITIDTNGTDPENHDVLRIALQPFTYVLETSEFISAEPLIVDLNAPTRFPITDAITEINGVTPEMVNGKLFNINHLTKVLTQTDLIISQQAWFVRPFLERLIPETATKAWACLIQDIPWEKHGVKKPTLHKLINHFGFFLGEDLTSPPFAGKPADAIAGVTILNQPISNDGPRVLSVLRQNALTPHYRIRVPTAQGNPMLSLLKARGYKYRANAHVKPAEWTIDLPAEAVEPELAWLNKNIFPSDTTHKTTEITAFNRYSASLEI